MKVLLTGCAGFIGANTASRLLAAGHSVVGIDNLNSAYDVRLKQWRLKKLQDAKNFEFHAVDITHRDRLPAQDVDAVINLAARAGVRQSLEDPWVYVDTNLVGTLNLLEWCRARRVPKFVLASTSSVYGVITERRPFREDENTDRPISPYAASKKAAEGLAYTYHHLHGIDVTVFRFFTVYGPAGRPDMSILRFIRAMSENEPLTVFGDGTQERDFTFVDDIASGAILGLQRVGYEIFNLGNDRPVALNHVISLIEQGVGCQARIHRKPPHPTDVPATWADISKAKRILGWAPTTALEPGITRTIEWYREHRSWAKDVIERV